MRRHDDALLMRYHDGELDDAQRRRVEELLARSPEARARLAAFADLGQAMRARAAAAIEARSFDGFFARVERAMLEARPMSVLERLRVYVHEWLRPRALWPAAVATVAVAVLVALGLGLGLGRSQSNSCTIETLDYGGGAAAVFMIPDEGGKGSTTVIWARAGDDQDAGDPD